MVVFGVSLYCYCVTDHSPCIEYCDIHHEVNYASPGMSVGFNIIAIYCESADAIPILFKNNRIYNCEAKGWYQVLLVGKSITENCLFYDNTIYAGTLLYSTLFAETGGWVIVRNNIFYRNEQTAPPPLPGAAMPGCALLTNVDNEEVASIINNTFYDNYAYSGGASIYVGRCDNGIVKIHNNISHKNSFHSSGNAGASRLFPRGLQSLCM